LDVAYHDLNFGVNINGHILAIEEPGNKHSGKNMAVVVEQCVAQAKDELGCSVVAIVPNATSTVINMRKVIPEKLGIFQCSYPCHVLNLFVGDYVRDPATVCAGVCFLWGTYFKVFSTVLRVFTNSTLLQYTSEIRRKVHAT